MKFPSHFSPKISSMSFPLPIVSFTSIPIDFAKSNNSCSDFPVISKPVNFRIASVIETLGYGALKSISCSPKVALVVPFT